VHGFRAAGGHIGAPVPDAGVLRVGGSPGGAGRLGQQVGTVRVVLDQRSQHVDDGGGLGLGGGAQVDVFVVEGPQGGQGLGHGFGHPDHSGAGDGLHQVGDEGPELAGPGPPGPFRHHGRDHVNGHDAGLLRILQIVGGVGATVGPRHHFGFGS